MRQPRACEAFDGVFEMPFFLSATRQLVAALLATSLFTAPALAADSVINSGDTAWILTATALVLLMTLPGLALFYAGLVQSKNVVSVLMHHFAIAALMSILWVVAGYSLAFSGDGAWFGDLANSFMSALTIDAASGTVPESVFATFQMTFDHYASTCYWCLCRADEVFGNLTVFGGLAFGCLCASYPLGVGWRHHG